MRASGRTLAELWAGGAWINPPGADCGGSMILKTQPLKKTLSGGERRCGTGVPQVNQWTCISGPPSRGWEHRKLFPRTLCTKVRQNGSACGLFPCSLAGTFPFGGPFTDGPFTAGAAAAVAAATGAVAVGTGVALAPVTALPGFGTPIPWGAAGACPPSATPPIPPGGTAAGAGLAPSEHPANPLAAPARASAVTAHHTHLTGIGKNLQMVDLLIRSQPAGPMATFREARPSRDETAASATPPPSISPFHRLICTTSRASPGHQHQMPLASAGGSRARIRPGCHA